jgi:CDP-glycerol glycerophosphotransferase (TagB/SpsB family)
VGDHGGYSAALAAADLLITDGVSSLVEFQVFERPLIFVDRPGHRPFNEIGEIVCRGVHSVTCAEHAGRLAEKLLADRQDPFATDPARKHCAIVLSARRS